MTGEGIFADQISRLFDVACRKAGWSGQDPELSTAFFRRPGGSQMELRLSGAAGRADASRESANPVGSPKPHRRGMAANPEGIP